MPKRKSRLTLKNPFYVKPVRLSKIGQFRLKDAVRVYLGHLHNELLRTGKLPSEDFKAVKVTMNDFADQIDKKAVVRVK